MAEESEFANSASSIYDQLTETQIKYEIFILQEETETINSANNNNNNNKIDYPINSLFQQLTDSLDELSLNYIWNNEKFSLTHKKPHLQKGSFYICDGFVDYGDNVDDEWFIVHLLLQLTRKFAGHVAAHVYDSDGQFLLIHAANYLPEWASSAADDCMHNRVFLFNGEVHMIPPATNPAQVTYFPAAGKIQDPMDAIQVVFDFVKITRAPEQIQNCIKTRTSSFAAATSNPTIIQNPAPKLAASPTQQPPTPTNIFHRATCTIPAKLAWLLKNQPSLISAAVNRFCDKDPADLKLCRSFENFKPVDLVNYRIRFTKHLYGKLKYCDYKPEKRHLWPSCSQIITNTDSALATATMRERSQLGFKLTCAFEIMSKSTLSCNKNKNKSTTSKLFEKYVQRLKNLGYFKEFLEGSKPYNELLEAAKRDFHNQSDDIEKDETEKSPKNVSFQTPESPETPKNEGASPDVTKTDPTEENHRIAELLKSLYCDNETALKVDYVTQVKEEIRIQDKEVDDSDEWLCVDAPELDDYLEMYSRGDVGSSYDFNMISNAFKRFLQKPKLKADLLGGVEFKSIDKSDAQLVDFNLESIESDIKELLSAEKKNKNEDSDASSEEENDDDMESDSFYEVGNDEFEENANDFNTNLNLKTYMKSMDDELKEQTEMGRLGGATKKGGVTTTNNSSSNNSDELNIDLNLVTNALESYSSQLGLTGPVSNILKSLGI